MDLNEVQANLQEVDQIKENIKSNIEQVILREAKAINQEYPEVIQMSWYQYTPGFNDGDPCVFSIGAVGFFTEAALNQAAEEGEDISGYNIEEYDITYDLEDGPLKTRLNNLSDLVFKLEEFMGALYGTWGAQIHINMVTGDLTVEEYDCGY